MPLVEGKLMIEEWMRWQEDDIEKEIAMQQAVFNRVRLTPEQIEALEQIESKVLMTFIDFKTADHFALVRHGLVWKEMDGVYYRFSDDGYRWLEKYRSLTK